MRPLLLALWASCTIRCGWDRRKSALIPDKRIGLWGVPHRHFG
jgi:hypothetical protein